MIIWKVTENGKVAIDEDLIGLLPTLAKLSTPEIQAVVLLTHPEGPFINYSEEQRPSVVANEIFGDYNWTGWSKKKIKDAIDLATIIFFDPLYDQERILKQKIIDINKVIENLDMSSRSDRTELASLTKTTGQIRKDLEALQRDIIKKKSGLKMRGNKLRSYIEKILAEGRLPKHNYFPEQEELEIAQKEIEEKIS